jgi:hypothetical protein
MSSGRPVASRWAATVALLPLTACSPGDELEIALVRPAPPEAAFAKADASSRERFGGGPEVRHDATRHAEKSFVFETPDGWIELAPQQFRDVNLRPGGHPELECYVTVLQGAGGGLSANVNRWRGQLGLEPMGDDDMAALPATSLLGRAAVRVELSGEGADARALLGVVLSSAGSMVTVKMTGPSTLVEEQRAGFDRFCETLAMHEHGAAEPVAAAPRPQAGLDYEVPEGWVDAGASNMRLVNLRTADGSQCYVIRLAGQAGGLANNLNRWRGEVGLEHLDPAELDALPKVELMGQECSLLEVSGEYRGMGDQAGPGMTLLGVALIGDESSLFVKMVGAEADVAAERQSFIDFLSSLAEAGADSTQTP